MRVFTLNKKQVLPISLDEAWAFFSNPYNLEKITPASMAFSIKNDVSDKIYNGMIIKYTVTPLFGIKCGWLTEIKHVNPPYLFVDEQRKGPYRLWYHQHHFKSVKNGVEIVDIVHYAPPGGVLSGVINNLVIKHKLETIFNHRYQVIEKKFGMCDV